MTSKYSAVSGEVIAYFHSKANIEGRFLLIEISEYYKSLYYDKSRYNDFSNIINTAANFYQKTINISKTKFYQITSLTNYSIDIFLQKCKDKLERKSILVLKLLLR